MLAVVLLFFFLCSATAAAITPPLAAATVKPPPARVTASPAPQGCRAPPEPACIASRSLDPLRAIVFSAHVRSIATTTLTVVRPLRSVSAFAEHTFVIAVSSYV
jgi:hypothetical protein